MYSDQNPGLCDWEDLGGQSSRVSMEIYQQLVTYFYIVGIQLALSSCNFLSFLWLGLIAPIRVKTYFFHFFAKISRKVSFSVFTKHVYEKLRQLSLKLLRDFSVNISDKWTILF
jgi:hypothetical protein